MTSVACLAPLYSRKGADDLWWSLSLRLARPPSTRVSAALQRRLWAEDWSHFSVSPPPTRVGTAAGPVAVAAAVVGSGGQKLACCSAFFFSFLASASSAVWPRRRCELRFFFFFVMSPACLHAPEGDTGFHQHRSRLLKGRCVTFTATRWHEMDQKINIYWKKKKIDVCDYSEMEALDLLLCMCKKTRFHQGSVFQLRWKKNASSLVPVGGWLIQASSTIARHYQAALTNIAASTQKKR